MKKKCFATLSGLILAISIIAPFSFVYASSSDAAPHIFYTYKKEVQGNTTYMVTDYYFMSNTYITTNLKIIWNNSFRINGNGEESSYIVEADGETGFTRTISSSGSGSSISYKYIWEITLNNSSYFHFQVRSPAALWSSTDVSRYSYYVNSVVSYGNNSTIDNSSFANTGVQANDYSIYLMLKQIRDNISSGGSASIDLTVIEEWLETIEGNQDSIILVLNDIKDLLQNYNSGNTQTNNTVSNNDSANVNAETVIDNYDTLTSTFESDFVDSQEDMTTIMENNTLSQFSSAMIWFTAQLGSLYNSLGDMQILVILPLLLGIALFFIGRGNVIFRDPHTYTENDILSETYYDKDSGLTSTKTYTHTYRKRGK